MKPEAPGSARSLFPTIPTNVPGIDICEHLPRLANMMDPKAMPFDSKRMVFGGFRMLVHL